LKPVAPAPTKGDVAKVAWFRAEKQLDKANARIARGAACWSGVVARYKGG
jgi:hypothetical protein